MIGENDASSTWKNKLILLLLTITWVFLLAGILLYVILVRQYRVFYRMATIAALVGVYAAALFMGITVICVFLVNSGKGEVLGAGRLLRKILDLTIFPAMAAGRMFGIDRETVQRAYAQINNRIVYSSGLGFRPQEVLLLLPHCIQDSECKHKITGNVYNCAKCGKCPVSEIIDLCGKYNINMVVVPGGTLARKAIKEHKPKAVIAVACEEDLCSGIHDARLIPVVGILNERPMGPCFNTQVNIGRIESAVNQLCNRRDV
ncbi:MAG: DUF116 domain-containing protein [Bacillota bacterium]|nr:DUF116 domain-containing protein [Bacillota bacterium]